MKGLGHKMSQDKARFHHGTWGAIWCHVPGHSLFDAGEDSTAQCPMSLKFGAKSSTWRELLRMIQELKLNLAGVSFHVGSGADGKFHCNDMRDRSSRNMLSTEHMNIQYERVER